MFYDKRIQEVTRFNQILSFKKRIYASQHTFHIIHRLKRNDNFKVTRVRDKFCSKECELV